MQSTKPAKRRFTTQQQPQQLLDDFYAELDEGLFEQVISGFKAEVEDDDDDDDDDDDGDIYEAVPEEEDDDVNKDVDAQEDEVLTDELPKKQRFVSTDTVCDNNNFQTVPEQPPETFKWKNQADEEMVWKTQRLFIQNPNPKRPRRRSLKDLPIVSRPTHVAKKNCDAVDGQWRSIVTGEALQRSC